MHFPHFEYTLNRELTELYVSIALRNFTLGLISIFVPIYIFIYFSQDLSKTILFFGVIGILHGALSPLAGKIITKLGVKHSMLASVPFLFLYYLGLLKIQALGSFFFLIIPIAVLHNIFYWPAFHIDFTRFSDQQSMGKQLSYRHTVAALSAAAAPFVGGLIIVKMGYPVLFAIVLVLLFSSIIPLFLSKEVHETYTDSFQKAYREIFQKKYRNKAIAFFAEGAEVAVQGIIWPIFLFALAISYSSIGGIWSVALFVGILFALYLGKATDRIGHGRLLILGSWLNAFTWPLKMFVQTPLDAFLVNTLHQLTRLSSHLPFGALFYNWSARHDVNRDRFIIFREMTHNIGMGIFLIVLSGIFLYFENMAIAFPIAGVLSLFMTFFVRGVRDEAN